ncbi:monovalent cation/H(+) antiporter subunit G [Sulfitobacter sp. F26169L]|uniref:monovalent cation/H(+) antiporter subunit G n=1 Tax=Sulfitobacter sp. F26169L TaxID=2996015 RepID=UPI0022609231|nr:monovalent cation/H(+) antiporter subunit G [Sulfitobacter sp. F26169L]MCX7564745.1 monovalent cation/H(+) antiporter subunit G [Sulfitobacter sp. F26169L]
MTYEIVTLYVITFCLIVGAAFTLIGAIGLLKFNDSMTRLHAPTKVGTVGVGGLLLASIIYNGVFGEGAMHETLIMAFLFVTAPISANFIAKVNMHRRACDQPPELPGDEQWATFDLVETDNTPDADTISQ